MKTLLLLIVVLAAEQIEATEACTRKLDLTLAIDSSSTVCGGTEPCPEWYAILQFCKDIVNGLIIGPDDTMVAFVTVADAMKMEWNLNRYTNKTALLSAIDGVAYYGGELKNLLAGSIIWTSVFHLDFGDRLIVPNVIMWITDGIPLIADEPGDALSNAYQTLGIKVLVVCITPGCDERMAKGEASPPKKANVTYFLLDSYLSINDIRDNLIKQICSYGQNKLF